MYNVVGAINFKCLFAISATGKAFYIPTQIASNTSQNPKRYIYLMRVCLNDIVLYEYECDRLDRRYRAVNCCGLYLRIKYIHDCGERGTSSV